MKTNFTKFLSTHYLMSICLSLIVSAAAYGQYGGVWTSKTGIEKAHAATFVVSVPGIGNCGFVVSGQLSNGTLTKDASRYDPNTNTWAQVRMMTVKGSTVEDRRGAVGFALSGSGYVGLGQGATTGNLADFYKYDPATNTWTKLTGSKVFPSLGRSFASTFVVSNKAYLCGGLSIDNNNGYSGCYSFNGNTWNSLEPLPGNKFAAATMVVGGNGHIVTGATINVGSTNVNANIAYTISANIWNTRANFPGTSRMEPIGFSFQGVNGTGYIGMGGDQQGPNTIFADIYAYKPNNTWCRVNDYTGTKAVGMYSFAIDGTAYTGGGEFNSSSNVSSSMYAYNRFGLTTNATNVCSNVNFPVTVTTADCGSNSGNLFKVEISDLSGKFLSPTEVGSLSSVATGNLVITTNIPNTVPAGNYKLRVRSTDPYSVSSNEVAIAISSPTVGSTVSGPASFCQTSKKTFSLVNSIAGFTYQWYATGSATIIGTSGSLATISGVAPGGQEAYM